MPGFYIAFEGIEGCGKTTQTLALVESLRTSHSQVVLTRETGGTAIGQQIRDVLHDVTNTHLDPVAEALLIAGDRAQHRAEILDPALLAGRHVVSDRSVYSTLAYQGYGRDLPLAMVRQVNDWALAGRWPDLVILLEVDHGPAMERLRSRALDRFENEDEEFFRRVSEGFKTMALQDPDHWLVVNGQGSPTDIAREIRQGVADRLGL
jgi:dTMP kinase